MSNEPICEECGLPISSQEHIRGVGIHGHERTSDEEANEQRADVFARALAFSEAQAEMPATGAQVEAFTSEKAYLEAKAEALTIERDEAIERAGGLVSEIESLSAERDALREEIGALTATQAKPRTRSTKAAKAKE